MAIMDLEKIFEESSKLYQISKNYIFKNNIELLKDNEAIETFKFSMKKAGLNSINDKFTREKLEESQKIFGHIGFYLAKKRVGMEEDLIKKNFDIVNYAKEKFPYLPNKFGELSMSIFQKPLFQEDKFRDLEKIIQSEFKMIYENIDKEDDDDIVELSIYGPCWKELSKEPLFLSGFPIKLNQKQIEQQEKIKIANLTRRGAKYYINLKTDWIFLLECYKNGLNGNFSDSSAIFS